MSGAYFKTSTASRFRPAKTCTWRPLSEVSNNESDGAGIAAISSQAELNAMYEMRRSQISRAILDYLSKNPHAQDTLLGIAQWWLPQQQIKTNTTTLNEALTELVDRGLILQSKGKDCQLHYRLNRRKLGQITAILRNAPKPLL